MTEYVGPNGETYWGEPVTEDEKQLVEDCQRAMLYGS